MTCWHILVFWLDKRATGGGTSPAVHIMNRTVGPVSQERYGERRTRMLNEGPAGERDQWEEAWRGMPLLTHPHCLSFHPFFCPPPYGCQEGGLTSNDSDKLACSHDAMCVYYMCECSACVFLSCMIKMPLETWALWVSWQLHAWQSLTSVPSFFFSSIGCVSLCGCVCVFGKSG